MRVISGKARGLKLNAPKDNNVRPTTDRVKESLFNIINSYIIDSEVLDLFAGTGSLGIECLSRNAKSCVFVDINNTSLDIVKSNIKKAKVEKESTVLKLDFKSAINKLKPKKFDIIFMDPPYYENLFIECLEEISKSNILKQEGIIVVEHDTKELLEDNVGDLIKTKSKKYGNTTLIFYELEE